jgi:hypothetical protein
MKLIRLSPLLAALALPAHALTNPPIRMAPQGVEYMCGGIGKDELAFMQMVSPHWGATFEFAVAGAPRGQFDEPVQVRVTDRFNGYEVMDAPARGPFMLARLNPGTYDVQATLGSLTITRTVVVAVGAPGRTLFTWPSNFDMASVNAPSQTLAQGSPAHP